MEIVDELSFEDDADEAPAGAADQTPSAADQTPSAADQTPSAADQTPSAANADPFLAPADMVEGAARAAAASAADLAFTRRALGLPAPAALPRDPPHRDAPHPTPAVP